jgi:hypothetical protein
LLRSYRPRFSFVHIRRLLRIGPAKSESQVTPTIQDVPGWTLREVIIDHRTPVIEEHQSTAVQLPGSRSASGIENGGPLDFRIFAGPVGWDG